MAYFSNSDEGMVLEEQCANCPLGYGWNDPNQGQLFENEKIPKPCPVAFIQFNNNYSQVEKGQERLRDAMRTLVNDSGTCQVRELLVQCRKEGSL